MKIFDAPNIRQWDQATMAEQNIDPSALMKRAGEACADWLFRHYGRETSICIAIGKGGNGGDGLVIARALILKGYRVFLLLSAAPKELRGAAQQQWQQLLLDVPDSKKPVIKILGTTLPAASSDMASPVDADKTDSIYEDVSNFFNTSGARLVIDTLLGTGYRPRPEPAADPSCSPNVPLNPTFETILAINDYISQPSKQRRQCVSIDLPSGLTADALPPSEQSGQPVIHADYTLSFQSYKRSFMHPESAPYIGQIVTIDIQLSRMFYRDQATPWRAVNQKMAVKRWIPRTSRPFGHKGSFGTAVLVGGSYGKIGAIALSASAALRAGAGKVFVQAPKCGYEIIQTFIPEAMFDPAGESYIGNISTNTAAVYGIGPGMDTHPESVTALLAFLHQQQKPVILDADALNIIATDPNQLLPLIPKNSILTPHPGEFLRLFGPTKNSMEQVNLASEMAKQWQFVIVVKGHRTAICSPEGKIYYNLTGNAGMATAGSGDVLTGIITALVAQGYPSIDAAILGVFLHGLSGDLFIKRKAPESLIARDLIETLPLAIGKLSRLQRKFPKAKGRT